MFSSVSFIAAVDVEANVPAARGIVFLLPLLWCVLLLDAVLTYLVGATKAEAEYGDGSVDKEHAKTVA